MWTYERPYGQVTVSLQKNELFWDILEDDYGRELNAHYKQSLDSFFTRGPALHRWPFFHTEVPLEICDAIGQTAGRGRPAWSRPWTPEEIRLFELASAPSDTSSSLIKLLTKGNINPDLLDGFGMTSVWWAARLGEPETVLTLLKLGADSRRNYEGVPGFETLLHAAVSRGFSALVSELTGRFGVDPNRVNEAGQSALFFVRKEPAVGRLTSAAVTRALLDAGANPQLRANNGETPFEYALRNQLYEMAALLKAPGP